MRANVAEGEYSFFANYSTRKNDANMRMVMLLGDLASNWISAAYLILGTRLVD